MCNDSEQNDAAGNVMLFGIRPQIIFVILLLILVIPAGIFIQRSYVQLDSILTQISEDVDMASASLIDSDTMDEPVEHMALRAKIALEHDVVVRRNKRAAAALATRTWMRFMSLIFGSILIVIGSAFILGRITTSKSEGRIGFKELSVSLVSTSPGLILAALGIVLIAIPNLSSQTIITDDTPAYIEKASFNVAGIGNAADHRESVLQDILNRERAEKKEEGDEDRQPK